MDREKLRIAPLMKCLPHIFGRNESVPSDLEGAEIIQVGTFEDETLVETGGLVIEYRPAGGNENRRLVFAFNDEAMWTVAYFRET